MIQFGKKIILKMVLCATILSFAVTSQFAFAIDLFGGGEICKIYNDAFIRSNKQLAANYSDGIGDNSAVRETNRQLKDLNGRILQLILVEQMKEQGCDIPKPISTGSEWYSSALDCDTALLDYRGNKTDANEKKAAIACDRSKWKSNLGSDHPIYK